MLHQKQKCMQQSDGFPDIHQYCVHENIASVYLVRRSYNQRPPIHTRYICIYQNSLFRAYTTILTNNYLNICTSATGNGLAWIKHSIFMSKNKLKRKPHTFSTLVPSREHSSSRGTLCSS